MKGKKNIRGEREKKRQKNAGGGDDACAGAGLWLQAYFPADRGRFRLQM